MTKALDIYLKKLPKNHYLIGNAYYYIGEAYKNNDL